YNDDGHATERAVDILFNGADCPRPEWLPEVVGSPEPDGRINVLVALDNKLRMSAVQALYMLLQSLDPSTHRVIIAAHSFHLFLEESERLFPGVQVIFAKLLADRSLIKKEQSDDFYQGQFDNYFPGMHFDQYYNLKNHEGFLDTIVSHVFPDIEKHWHFSWTERLNEGTVSELIQSYEEVLIYCPRKDELPESLLDAGARAVTPRDIRNDARHRMTVLLITGIDSTNYALAACAQELVARGHKIIVATGNPRNATSARMFVEAGLDLVSLGAIDSGAMNFVDLAIGSPIKPSRHSRLYRMVLRYNIPLFAFAGLFSSIAMRINPDFLFTLGESKMRELKAYNLKYNCVAMGNPQYDSLLKHRRDGERKPIKSVLIAEQGGYPYGEKGKRQLAETLMRIARDNKSIEFAIKPRYNPDDGGKVFHNVSEHLFSFLGDAPENLTLLTTHEKLEDIIVNYDAFITMWSTAYLDAVMLNIPLLLIDGFDSVDVFDVRSQRVSEAYDQLRGTGCLHHYSELKGDITDKFRLVDEAYAADEIYALGKPCAPRVADFMEHVYGSLVIPELRIADDFACNEKEFYEKFDSLRLVDAGDSDYEVKRRYRDMLNTQLQEIVYQNRCMGAVLDLKPLEQLYDLDLSGVTLENLGEFNGGMRRMIAECFSDIRMAFFDSEEGRNAIESDAILQDFYFDWLYAAERYDEIENPVVEHLLVPESREYNLARVALRRHRISKAYDHLFEFLRISESRDVVQLLKCKRLKARTRPFRRGLMKPFYFRRLLLAENKRAVEYVYGEIDRNPLLAYNEARQLRKAGDYNACVLLCDQAQLHYSAKGWRRSSVTGTAKLYVKKLFYYLLEQEREKACDALEGVSSNDENALP
ncbi:MAG: hypothetical protein IJ087_16345, partial [Eggerthellaceae bacterium]|nr:hypothetical protein [Eggerthellaceae bacterium]